MRGYISYEKIRAGGESAVCELVMECFNKFVAPGYSNEGIEEFVKYVNPDCLKERLRNGNFVLVALIENAIVGVIEIRSFNHVSLLFVKEEYHQRGIAKGLLEKAIKICLENNTEIKSIDVNSSPFAVEIYKKMGFKQTGEDQIKNGIRYIPLTKTLV